MFKFINYNGIGKKTIASDITASLRSFFFSALKNLVHLYRHQRGKILKVIHLECIVPYFPFLMFREN